MQSNRDENVREMIHSYVDFLLDLHDKTDPKHGKKSEIGKLERARRAIHVWWYAYDRLLLWAQSQIVGYSMLKTDEKLVEKFEKLFKKELTEDSHELEFIGLQYSWNAPNSEHKVYKKVQNFFEADDIDLTDSSLRSAVSELFSSTSANSSFWRFELSNALRALNEGEVLDVFEPAPLKRQGKPFSLKKWKVAALEKMYFLYGKGLKKHRALEDISKVIGVSSETLRDWDKDLRQNYDHLFVFGAAFIAGHLSTLNENEYAEARKDEELNEYYKLTSKIELAEHYLKFESKTSLEDIKEHIHRLRQKD